MHRLAWVVILQNFTGIDSPYKPPGSPGIIVSPQKDSLEEITNAISNSLDIQYT